ncbi:MAG TPA: hypothetical protein VNM47_05970 [Terriglobia bacterium]|nr:hypothetical protein [Terriglobia bacterium]
MSERKPTRRDEAKPAGVNPGYAALQIAKALTTSERHEDRATRERAEERVSKWEAVLKNILTGTVAYGSRTPVEGVPGWATLEVVTGGLATGELLAGGPLQEHEQKLLEEIPSLPRGAERGALNAHFLTDAGLAELRNRLHSGRYDVAVPEEGALMVVACLVEKGYAEDARGLLDQLVPYFSRLRFYPVPLEQPRRFGTGVHLQDVGTTLADLRRLRPNKRILAQKEAVEVWLPFYDRIVTLFLETVENDWPCQKYPDAWPERARALLGEYVELRREHTHCGKMDRAKEHSAQLRELLGRCSRNPGGLTGQEVGRIRLILSRYLAKRGAPDSPTCAAARRRQAADVGAPTFHAVAGVIAARLEKYPKEASLDDVGQLNGVVTGDESAGSSVPEGTSVPPSIRRKVERCLNETVDTLVERGLITSGETLARCLPQMTSGIRALGITEPALRQLYTGIYRAFRRRRSLLLLNLERQVQIEELPWVAAIERFRSDSLSGRELARQTLEEVVVLTLTSFPHAILPNKLLQELRVLLKGAGLDIPLVDELAADIFIGEFSGKFVESACRAADLLKGSLYAAYYGIDYEEVRRILKPREPAKRTWFWSAPKATPDEFPRLCASRAGVSLGTWDPATNGMVIEQQQILTTQNLAALFGGLNLADALRGQLGAMAKRCFEWICRRQQVREDKWHARLKMLKNTAYAWRQMLFFLALLPDRDVTGFLRWAEGHLDAQKEDFRKRFAPALRGLMLVANGGSIDQPSARKSNTRRFLGWSNTKHWLLADLQGK